MKKVVGLDHRGGQKRPNPDQGNAYGHENGNNDNNGNAYGHENGNNGQNNNKPGWGHQFKRTAMDMNYVIDPLSATNEVLMIYGDHYQIQRYTYGLEQVAGADIISMDFWEIEDHDNGWIPRGEATNLSSNPDRIYYLQDELGSIRKVIGEDGKKSAHYNYHEFGVPKPHVKFDQNWPGPDNTFAYTGYEYDVSADLYYAQARYYMPEIGRFISQDPWTGTQMIPNTMNPYPYVLNNPLTYVDPSGMKSNADFRMLEEGQYVNEGYKYYEPLPLGKYADIKEPAGKVYTAWWFDTRPYNRLSFMGSGQNMIFYGPEFVTRLIYLDSKKGIDVTQLTVKELDSIYEDVHNFQLEKSIAEAGALISITASGVKAISSGLNGTSNAYSNFAKQATKNPKSKEVVLGKFNQGGVSYTKVAESRGATYFQLDKYDDVVKEVGEKNIWNINESFIRQQASSNKTFILSHDPAKATGYFANEVNLLKDMGYKFIKEGSVWRAFK